MRAAGGETVEVALSGDRLFGRLHVSAGAKPQVAFLNADQLRELARHCVRAATEIDQEAAVPDECSRLRAEVDRYKPMADAANRVAELISILGPDDREYVQFTEGEQSERVEAVRALFDALEDY